MIHAGPLDPRITCGVLLVAGGLSSVKTADGQVGPPPPRLVSTEIPNDGALLIELPYRQEPVNAEVTDATGAEIPGTLSPLSPTTGLPLYVWRPSRELARNATYDVSVESSRFTVRTLGPATTEPLTFRSQPVLAPVYQGVGAQWCCSRIEDLPDSVVPSCFYAQQTLEELTLSLQLQAEVPAVELSQFVYRTTAISASGTPNPDGWAPLLSYVPAHTSFTAQKDDYCVRLELMNIVTEVVEAAPDFDPSCMAHGSLPDFGVVFDTDPADEGSLYYTGCPLPPDGFEAAWCDLNAKCEETESTPGCEGFGHVCRGEPLPIAGADAGAGRTSESADTATHGTDAAPTGGCGCRTQGARSQTSQTLEFALLVAVLMMTRRRR